MFPQHDVDESSIDDLLVGADGESEFIPLLGNIGGAIGNALKLPGTRPPLRPLRPGALGSARPGVDNAVLNTPGGTATVRLPEKVVTQDAFREATQRLEATINGLTAQLNATRSDVTRLSQAESALHAATRRALARSQRGSQGQAMMGMLMGMMASRDARSALDGHRHVSATGAVDPSTVQGGDSGLLMMLPMMMMSEDKEPGASGSSDSNMMMMMVMMMAMGRK